MYQGTKTSSPPPLAGCPVHRAAAALASLPRLQQAAHFHLGASALYSLLPIGQANLRQPLD